MDGHHTLLLITGLWFAHPLDLGQVSAARSLPLARLEGDVTGALQAGAEVTAATADDAATAIATTGTWKDTGGIWRKCLVHIIMVRFTCTCIQERESCGCPRG